MLRERRAQTLLLMSVAALLGGDTQETEKDRFPRAANQRSFLDFKGVTALYLLGICSVWSEIQNSIADMCQGHGKGV